MSDLSGFLDALDKLPAFDGLSFRGLEPGADTPPALGAAAAVLATSRDARLATENFTAARLLVLLNRTGRDVSPFSAQPQEAEVVVRPGTAWRALTEVPVDGLTVPALVLEELDLTGTLPAPTEWGSTIAELTGRVQRVVAQALARGPVVVTSPGKFVGPWVAREVAVGG